jgi:hypothetical protein
MRVNFSDRVSELPSEYKFLILHTVCRGFQTLDQNDANDTSLERYERTANFHLEHFPNFFHGLGAV